jgi:hypothetical protein
LDAGCGCEVQTYSDGAEASSNAFGFPIARGVIRSLYPEALRFPIKCKLVSCVCAAMSIFMTAAMYAQEPSPGFNSKWRNADGSSKLMLEFGGGFDKAAGATTRYQDLGWNYRMGGGYRVNRRVGVTVVYGYDRFSIPQSIVDSVFGDGSTGDEGIVGHVHLWSLTLQPVVEVIHSERNGLYVTGGGGFYRKVTTFSAPCNPNGQDPCFLGALGEDRISNNAGGANGAVGVAHRISNTYNAKLFLEAGYVWVDNMASPNNPGYPPANQRTAYFPITAGVRW